MLAAARPPHGGYKPGNRVNVQPFAMGSVRRVADAFRGETGFHHFRPGIRCRNASASATCDRCTTSAPARSAIVRPTRRTRV